MRNMNKAFKQYCYWFSEMCFGLWSMLSPLYLPLILLSVYLAVLQA